MIQIGDRVRSFDFANSRDVDGERACYVEGVLEGFKEVEGCQRYVIRVDRKVFGGQEEDILGRFKYVYPPANGTPTPFGGLTCFVELV